MKIYSCVFGLTLICLLVFSFMGCAEDTGNGNGNGGVVSTVLTPEDKLQGSYILDEYKVTVDGETWIEDGPPEATGTLTLSSGGSYTSSVIFTEQSGVDILAEILEEDNPSGTGAGSWSADSTHLTLNGQKAPYSFNGSKLSITHSTTGIVDGATINVSHTITWKKV